MSALEALLLQLCLLNTKFEELKVKFGKKSFLLMVSRKILPIKRSLLLLTKERHETFLKARQLFNMFKCWAKSNIVVVGADGIYICIRTVAELNSMAPTCSKKPPTRSDYQWCNKSQL